MPLEFVRHTPDQFLDGAGFFYHRQLFRKSDRANNQFLDGTGSLRALIPGKPFGSSLVSPRERLYSPLDHSLDAGLRLCEPRMDFWTLRE